MSLIVNIFRPYHSPTYIDAAYCYRPSSVVCLSVNRSVTVVNRLRCHLASGIGWAKGTTY